MRLFSPFAEKANCYPLNHLSGGDNGHLFFHVRDNGLYPLIRDGDILRVQHITPSDLRPGDLTLVERPGGRLAVHLVLRKGRHTQKTLPETEVNRADRKGGLGNRGSLVGLVAAIERDGQTKGCGDRLARLSHLIYFLLRPLLVIFLFVRKIVSLFDPRFFVKDADSSLHSVAQKFNEDVEVFYYSERALDGLDEQEQHLVEQYMRRRGRVLNIGCGAGREAFALAELGFQVVGIDVAPRMIEAASRLAASRGKNICFEVKSATNLDYTPQSFDYVFMSEGVYSLIPTRDLRIDVLRNVGKLLAPDGTLLLSALYRRAVVLSRVSLYGVFRRIAKRLLSRRLHSEPGDTHVRYVSHASKASKLCYMHLFADADEVWKEVSSAGIDGFEDKQTGYWVVRPFKDDSSQEVAA